MALARQRYLPDARDRTHQIVGKHHVFSCEMAKRMYVTYPAPCRTWLAAGPLIVTMAAYMATQRYKDMMAGVASPEQQAAAPLAGKKSSYGIYELHSAVKRGIAEIPANSSNCSSAVMINVELASIVHTNTWQAFLAPRSLPRSDCRPVTW